MLRDMPDGGCLPRAVSAASSLAAKGRLLVTVRRLVLLCNYQFGVGQRPRTALEATATGDDSACDVPWRAVQHGWANPVRHNGGSWRKRHPWPASLMAAA